MPIGRTHPWRLLLPDGLRLSCALLELGGFRLRWLCIGGAATLFLWTASQLPMTRPWLIPVDVGTAGGGAASVELACLAAVCHAEDGLAIGCCCGWYSNRSHGAEWLWWDVCSCG